MNSHLYEQKRNELIALLDGALRVQGLPPEHLEKIRHARMKALENQFVVVLVGEFQGGKSTSFNALCDGREISPRGIGIKTSACVMAGKNISEEGERERAEIQWKTPRDLLLSFIEILEDKLRLNRPERFSIDKAPAIADAINLNDIQDRKLLSTLLQDEWRLWKQNKGAYAPERLDLLQMGELVVRFFGTKPYLDLISRTEFSIQEAGKLVTFPRDAQKQWADWEKRGDIGAAPFAVEDCVYVFIARVTFRIHSQNLARTGSMVLDCPGLFASAWDTKIAQEAMFDADAIWYLFNGSKQLTQGDVQALRFIKQRGWETKLFYTVNMRDRPRQIIAEQIAPLNAQKLSSLGFDTPVEDVHLYDALLALRSCQGSALLAGTLDQHSATALKQEAADLGTGLTELADIWIDSVQSQLLTLKDPNRREFKGLDSASIEVVRKVSCLDEILGSIEDAMIKRKARSILIDQGADLASQSLRAFEGALQVREQNAEQTKAQFEAQVQEAEAKINQFSQKCHEELKALTKEEIDTFLFNDLVETALKPAFFEVSTAVATELCEDTDSLYWEALANKSKLTARVSALVKQRVDEMIPPCITKWQTNMMDGQNEVYNFSIVQPGQRILKQITEEWEEILRENKGILLIQNIETQNTIDLHSFVGEKGLRLDSDVDVSTESFQAVGLYIAGYLANGILAGLSHPLVGIILLVAALMLQEKVKEQLQGKIQMAINDSLIKAIAGEEMQKSLKKALSIFRTSIKSQIEAGTINRIHEELGRRKEVSLKNFKESQDVRDRIAAEAKTLRETLIIPSREKIESFRTEVAALTS